MILRHVIIAMSLCLVSNSVLANSADFETRVSTHIEQASQLAPRIGVPADGIDQNLHSHFYTLRSGQTITQMLLTAGFSSNDIYALVNVVNPLFNLEKVRAGSRFEVSHSKSGPQIKFASHYGVLIKATLLDKQWLVEQITVPVTSSPISKTVEINHSLYKAASRVEIPANIINSAIMAMSHFVDFQREIRRGDKLTLKFQHASTQEETALFAHLSPPQHLVAIEFENNKQLHQLYHYKDAFYFNDGKLAQNFLLKTPLNGARLSSTFGNRKHPVLGYSRQHKGVDFSAPLGTPIMAAGRGKVVKAHYSKSFGFNVVLDHGDGYRTLYAHLKGFAKGIKAGSQVTQGQTIGYLGNTGLSTARHLHYEVHKNGLAINPLSLKQPSHIQLKGQDLVAFQTHIKSIDERYVALSETPTRLTE